MKTCIKCKKEITEESKFCSHCGTKQSSSDYRRMRGNGLGSAYKRGNTWVAQIQSYVESTDDEGNLNIKRLQKRKGGFATKKEALAYLDTLKVKRRNHTVSEMWEIFSKNAMLKLSDSRQQKYHIAYERIKPMQTMQICDLTIDMLQNNLNENTKTYYPANDIKSLWSQIFKLAMAQQEVSVNLSQFLVLPDLHEKDAHPFNEDELKKMWGAFEADPSTGYILLMIYSGMMPGELQKCKKTMIDFENQNIIGCGIKTKKRQEIPIGFPDFIIPVLQNLIKLSPTEYLADMTKHQFYDWYYAKLEDIGVRKLPPYSCRHTTGTALALGNKVALSVIQKIMRHAKFTTTQRYIHPDASDVVAGLNTLEKCES